MPTEPAITEEQLQEIGAQALESENANELYRINRKLIAEIRRLREMNRMRNHCAECGNLNPVDNICDGCYQQIELGK